MFFNNNNNNFQDFLEKNSLVNVQREYPTIVEDIYKTLKDNFTLSVVNVNIRQNFIIMDLLQKINSNIEKMAKKN